MSTPIVCAWREPRCGNATHVVRQLDNATPQPAQKFTPENFLEWAQKQVGQARKVYSCYEAGPFGYVLHRKLCARGIENVVVRPQNWDELGKRVKTDKTAALAAASTWIATCRATAKPWRWCESQPKPRKRRGEKGSVLSIDKSRLSG